MLSIFAKCNLDLRNASVQYDIPGQFKDYLYLNFMKRLTVLILVCVVTLPLNTQLPKLIKTEYAGNSLPVINVTMGEKFSIPFPHFDAVWEKKTFKAYQISLEQFNKFAPIEQLGQQKQIEAEPFDSKQISMDYLPFQCSLSQPRMKIKQQIKSIRQGYSRFKNTVWQENQYIHISFKSLIYILNVASSELIAYLYNERTIEKLTTYKLNEYIQREEEMADISTSAPVIAPNSNQDSLFIFTSLGIWQIRTRTILADVRMIEDISGFNSKNTGGIDKILHGQGKIMVGLKRLSKVYIIPENQAGQQKTVFKEISSYKGQKQFYPQDIILISNTLYVLDYKKGVYIYTIMNKGSFTERAFISFESFGGNFMFEIYQNSIFINFNDIDGSKIVEINFDIENQQHQMVRYIKSDDYICSLQIFSVLTEYQGRPLNQKYNAESFDTFLFLLLNFDDIEIYPFNIDPRIINHSYNGVKFKGNDIRKIFHLKTDLFIIITNELIKYVRISIQKPAVVCKTKKGSLSSPSNYFRLTVLSNVSTCEHKNHKLPQKRLSNQYCQLQNNYFVHIGDPEQSQFQKLMLYTLVIGVVVLFVCGLICLMQWRKNKMVILGRLKNQILRFRNRHKKMQPFAEQNMEHKQIEIEMPEVHAVSQSQQ